MDWIINNWYIVLGLIAVVIAIVVACRKFLGLPTDKQIAKVMEWLEYACAIVEKELGGKTGELKLRKVYDMFLIRFNWLAKVVPFELFSELVKVALKSLEEKAKENKAIENFITNKTE